MAIPVFMLPSNKKITVQFREPTIEDCIEFSGLNEALSERSATQYLNLIQIGQVNDSATWTAQDRIAALWWVFVCISPDTLIPFQYTCSDCGEKHVVDIDLMDLDDESITLNCPPFIKKKLSIAGKEQELMLHHPNGRAMEHMEQQKLILSTLEPGSREHSIENAKLRVFSVAHSFSLPGEDGDFDTALENKMALINKMSRTSEYQDLVIATEAAKEALKHGLNCSVIDGEVFINSPVIYCENKPEGQATPRRLLFPFHSQHFIPAV
ncbi:MULTISPECIES: hypothetical protein [Shewanella]|uniref:hypothetical protein n=1 Tax=Shewanella TaxID=22 RepID=UPI003004E3EB